MAKEAEFDSLQGRMIFLFSIMSSPALKSTQPRIQWVSGALLAGVKQVGCGDDCLLLCSTKINDAWIYASTLPYIFMAFCLIKHRGNFNFGTYFISYIT
jgi:hypothetical protein